MKTRAEKLRQDAFTFEQEFDLRFTNNDLNRSSFVSDMNDLVQTVSGRGGVTSPNELRERLLKKRRALLSGAFTNTSSEGRSRASVLVSGALEVLSVLS